MQGSVNAYIGNLGTRELQMVHVRISCGNVTRTNSKEDLAPCTKDSFRIGNILGAMKPEDCVDEEGNLTIAFKITGEDQFSFMGL